jgi:hypothetical protein
LTSSLQSQAVRSTKPSKKTTPAAKPASQDFNLPANQPYCDTSLAYGYISTPKDVTLQVLAKPLSTPGSSPVDWAAYLQGVWNSQNPPKTPPASPAIHVTFAPLPASSPTVALDALPDAQGMLHDSGQPLLGAKDSLTNDTTLPTQRLLIRTLFGPNPFQNACAYPYLKSSVPPQPGPVLDANGKPISLLAAGAGYSLDLNSPTAPKYYLINIVRWADAPAPKASNPAPAAPAATPAIPSKPTPVVPYFQAQSDNWYLLNYSDDQARQQDLTKAFRRITPSMVNDTLRILGSNRVMFLGIHLAPVPSKTTLPNPDPQHLYPSEQAWFDDITIQYKLHADAAEPANMADLNTLTTILLANIGVTAPTAQVAQQAAATASFDGSHPLSIPLEGLKLAVESFNISNYSYLDLYLHELNPTTLRNYGGAAPNNQLLVLSSETDPTTGIEHAHIDISGASDNSGLYNKIYSQTDTNSVATAEASLNADETALGAISAALKQPVVLSTFQGLYAAGLLTNLTALPVNLTNSWTATFNSHTPQLGGGTAYGPEPDPGPATPPATTPAPAASTTPSTTAPATPTPPATPSTPATAPVKSATTTTPICTLSPSTDATAQTPCTHQGVVILNEGRASWDISVAVPLPGYTDLTFQSSTSTTTPNVITAKTVTRTNAYALLDLFLVPEDLINPPYVGVPHLIVGLPFAGKVFDKPYFAVGETLNIPKMLVKVPGLSKLPVLSAIASGSFPLSLRPTFGWVYNKEFPGGTTSSLTRRVLKPQFAIELSFSSIKNAVTTFTKTPKASTTTTK